MTITNIKDYLGMLFEKEVLNRNLNLAEKEIGFMEEHNIQTEIDKRDKGIVDNLNPSKDYCVVSVGSLHVPSVVNKLQERGYKTNVFLPKTKGMFADIVNYKKLEKELLEYFEKTQNSQRESLVIADRHLMIYKLNGNVKKPEELLEKGIKDVSICLEHSRPGNEDNFLFKKKKHCIHIYDELRDYAERCKEKGIGLELIGLECREDGVELC